MGHVRVLGFSSRMSACAQGNVSRPVFQLFNAVSKEHEICLRSCRLFAAKVEDAELEGRMDLGKECLLVLEVIQPDEPVRFGDRRKEILGCHVRSDARRYEQPHAAVRRDQSRGQLGEHRVGVDVPLAGQRVLVAFPAVRQQRIRRGQRLLISLVQSRIVGLQLGDELPPLRRVRRGGDLRGRQREELPLLQLHSLPRRIADHAIESGLARVPLSGHRAQLGRERARTQCPLSLRERAG